MSDPLVGASFAGRYQIETLLGEGGMGRVYAAHHTFTGRPVAIKLLHDYLAGSKMVRERFLREVRAPSSVRHPGIVEIVDAGEEQSSLYLVMERLQGRDLRVRQEAGEIDAGSLAQITLELLDVLEAAHAAGLVHRDIKPENVFVLDAPAEGRRVKLLDFGVTGLLKGSEGGGEVRLTQTGHLLGTPLYMSPEQARGERVDARSDLWAVGAILFEGLTGRTPYVAPNYNLLIGQILSSEPPPLRSLAPSAPPAIAEVVDRALVRDRERRWASAAEMGAAFRQALTVAPLTGVALGVSASGGAPSPVRTAALEEEEPSPKEPSPKEPSPKEPGPAVGSTGPLSGQTPQTRAGEQAALAATALPHASAHAPAHASAHAPVHTRPGYATPSTAPGVAQGVAAPGSLGYTSAAHSGPMHVTPVPAGGPEKRTSPVVWIALGATLFALPLLALVGVLAWRLVSTSPPSTPPVTPPVAPVLTPATSTAGELSPIPPMQPPMQPAMQPLEPGAEGAEGEEQTGEEDPGTSIAEALEQVEEAREEARRAQRQAARATAAARQAQQAAAHSSGNTQGNTQGSGVTRNEREVGHCHNQCGLAHLRCVNEARQNPQNRLGHMQCFHQRQACTAACDQ